MDSGKPYKYGTPSTLLALTDTFPLLLSASETAAILGVTARTLNASQAPNAANADVYPPAKCRVGRFWRWSADDVRAWLERQ